MAGGGAHATSRHVLAVDDLVDDGLMPRKGWLIKLPPGRSIIPVADVGVSL